MEGEVPAKPEAPITKGMDLTKFGRKASPESDELMQQAQRRIVSPGQLRQVLLNSGMEVVWRNPAFTTLDCAECGRAQFESVSGVARYQFDWRPSMDRRKRLGGK